MDTWIWIVIAAVVVVIVVALVAMAMRRKRRRTQLQGRFGSEYGRTVDDAGSRRSAERELREREAKVDELDLRPLSEASRQRYSQQWTDMQSTLFVCLGRIALLSHANVPPTHDLLLKLTLLLP